MNSTPRTRRKVVRKNGYLLLFVALLFSSTECAIVPLLEANWAVPWLLAVWLAAAETPRQTLNTARLSSLSPTFRINCRTHCFGALKAMRHIG